MPNNTFCTSDHATSVLSAGPSPAEGSVREWTLSDGEPDLFETAREAVKRLRGKGRLGNGQAGVGNSLGLKRGLQSRRLLET